jgi:hypothetical protein
VYGGQQLGRGGEVVEGVPHRLLSRGGPLQHVQQKPKVSQESKVTSRDI